MEEIAYNNRHVPSWSWMAYNGGIQFLEIPFSEVGWANDLQFDPKRENALIADIGDFLRCTMEPDRKQYAVIDSDGTKRGWIQYDVKDGEQLSKEQCVVIGRTKKSSVEEYYILVARPTCVDGEYNRVGVGLVHSCCVVKRGALVRVV